MHTIRTKFPHRTRFWTAGLVCCSDWSWASITQRFTVHLLPRGPGLHPCSFPQLSCYFYTFLLPGELLLKQQLSLNILSNVIHCVGGSMLSASHLSHVVLMELSQQPVTSEEVDHFRACRVSHWGLEISATRTHSLTVPAVGVFPKAWHWCGTRLRSLFL